MRSVEFHPEAAREAEVAAVYYEERRAGLGGEFVAETTRRLLFRRFPFGLVYLADATRIKIIAVAHQRREPGYWELRR